MPALRGHWLAADAGAIGAAVPVLGVVGVAGRRSQPANAAVAAAKESAINIERELVGGFIESS
jgi:hypothetical protein